MYKSTTSKNGLSMFLGVTTCNSCYHKFRSAVSDDATVGRLLGWLEKNLGINIKVTCSETGFIVSRYQVSPEFEKD